MDNQQYNEILNYLEKKQKECLVQKKAYEKWLRIVTPLRWLAIFVSVVAPAIVGLKVSGGIFADWQLICASVLFTSAIASGLHTGLKCDVHQQECLRLAKQYESLANKFELAKTETSNLLEQRKEELGKKYSDLIENTLTTPAQWCLNSATRAIMGH